MKQMVASCALVAGLLSACGGDGAGASTFPTGDDAGGAAVEGGAQGDGASQDDGRTPGEGSTPAADGGTTDDGGAPGDAPTGADASPGVDSGGLLGLHTSGNQIVDASGNPVRLLGVNRSGTEYSCIHGLGFFDGPSDQTSVAAITAWKANAVRVPLNEDCWLAINGAPAQYSGAVYQQAIASYVDLLRHNGIYPILELHWTAPGTQSAMGQQPMPDQDHSITFWSQVAARFAADGDVVLELFNEPYPDSNQDTMAAWKCWRDGGMCAGVSYPVAGMQSLLTAVRAAGAKNLVLLGGVQYSNALSQWLAYKPDDPIGNIAAAWHVYDQNTCNTTSCYDRTAGAVALQVPIVATEIGEGDCNGGFITTLMSWLDQKKQSYLGWTWDTWGGCLVLITDYAGKPAGTYGQTYKAHLLATPH